MSRLGPIVLIAVLSLVTVGCGVLSGPSEPGSRQSQQTTPASQPPTVSQSSSSGPTEAGSTSPDPQTSSDPTASPLPSQEPVARRDGAIEQKPVTLDLFPIEVRDNLATVNLVVRTTDPDDAIRIAGALNDHNPEIGAKSNGAPDGIRLLDPKNKRAYLAATTSGGDCLCSPDDSTTTIRREPVWWVSVQFAAPPADVKTFDVSIPGFGTVNDVPIV